MPRWYTFAPSAIDRGEHDTERAENGGHVREHVPVR
jgi:hypothetical protein